MVTQCDVESFDFASKRGVYKTSFMIWGFIRGAESSESASLVTQGSSPVASNFRMEL